MRAAMYYGPGDVRIEQVPEPGPLQPGWVRLRVRCASLCGTDASQFTAATMIPTHHAHPISGGLAPLILGHELVGDVIEVGPGVSGLEVGSRVVPGAGWWCGQCQQCQQGRINICEQYYLFGIHAHGGLAEQAAFPAKMCIPVPSCCSDEAAAMAQPCAVALHALGRSDILPGQAVALYGAGNIGGLMLATMRALGMLRQVRIIVVDLQPARLYNAGRLGATPLICASDIDPVAAILELTDGRGVDVCIDATGAPSSIGQALASVRRGGRLLQVGIPTDAVSLQLSAVALYEKEIAGTNGQRCLVDLPEALDLLAHTDLASSIGYRAIPLESLVEEGLRPLVEHRAEEKVIVTIG
jgi:(R,R)-butanediol dehydrogenase / meso-butanediol dehydrogenase / diacetyl reductase